ncbi:MAG: hypothetical protein QMD44_07125 [Thermodesulfovibrionales bacterium]|jgi:uncharacterized protein with HEPN domain|nr:hypothetical protein [Thermodesulfovibrionales bacterium]
MSRDYKLFIKDIVDAIKDIDIFVGDIDYRNFLKTKKHRRLLFGRFISLERLQKIFPNL